jgi:peroxiredoxin Q/BCP
MSLKPRLVYLSALALFVFKGASAQEFNVLKTGDKAPVFAALNDNNAPWDVSTYLGKKNIVVYFYPAAMTGGCTAQACAYRDSQKEFEAENAIVVGISGDEVENLKVFREAHNLNFPLLSDPTGEIAKKFGVPLGAGNSITREINGKQVVLQRGVTAKRWTFVIGTDGLIRYVNQEVAAANDPKEVLGILRAGN